MVNGNSAVRSKLFKCVQCRSLRRKLGIQKMANVPSSRLMEVPPFTYCGVGMFGPFIIRQRRSEVLKKDGEKDGDAFSMSSMSSGHVGGKIFYSHSKKGRNGKTKSEILKTVTLSY